MSTEDAIRYRALCAHDARFDGLFFVGVTTTGIYCRPVCRVRTPKRENCRFFGHAAQAEQAGFRPCLRCRPELAPGARPWSAHDAGAILVEQAMRWLNDPAQWLASAASAPLAGHASLVQSVAQRLGISERHLRRLFQARLGVPPLQVLQTRQLLSAKQMLADTTLPITQIAQSCGFGSQRRFNAAFRNHYAMNPTQLRRAPAAARAAESFPPATSVRLSWRPPYDVAHLLGFLGQRALPGVEWVEPDSLSLGRTCRLVSAAQTHRGWLRLQFVPAQHQVLLQLSEGLLPVLPLLIQRTRDWLDLEADPQAIHTVLASDFPAAEGVRVPGCLDGFELAVRAVLGQQVSVAAARTLAARLVGLCGEPLQTDDLRLQRLFPTPDAIAVAESSALGALGITRSRQAALQSLARAVLDHTLDLSPQAQGSDTLQALLALPGIGPWTAHYIALRALRWPDAWLDGDAVVRKALRGLEQGIPSQFADPSERWRPWRSHAVIRLWAGLHTGQTRRIPDTAIENRPVAIPARTSRSTAASKAPS